ncbi:hypothetical protein OROMI_033748 [Orobanche minor]
MRVFVAAKLSSGQSNRVKNVKGQKLHCPVTRAVFNDTPVLYSHD